MSPSPLVTEGQKADGKPECPLSYIRNPVQRTPIPADFGAQSRVPAELGTHTHTPLSPWLPTQLHTPCQVLQKAHQGLVQLLCWSHGPPAVLTWAGEGLPRTAGALDSSKPHQLHRWLSPFLLPEHPHLLQPCSPSQVMSGQAAECKSTQNLLLHQASFGKPVASCSRLCSPCRLGGRKSKEGEKPPQVLFRLRAKEPASPPRSRRKKQFIVTNGESLQRGWPFLSKLVNHTERGEGLAVKWDMHHSQGGKPSATQENQAARDPCLPTWDAGEHCVSQPATTAGLPLLGLLTATSQCPLLQRGHASALQPQKGVKGLGRSVWDGTRGSGASSNAAQVGCSYLHLELLSEVPVGCGEFTLPKDRK